MIIKTNDETKLNKITTGTNAKTYAYTRTQTSGTTATHGSLEIETAPTSSSINLITSGGVYTAIANGSINLKETYDPIMTEQLVRLINDKVYSRYGTSAKTQLVSSIVAYPKVCKISTNKFIVVYTQSSDTYLGHAVVASVSGTTVSLGTPVSFGAGTVDYLSVATIDTDKAIVCYRDGSVGTPGMANVLSVSGTTITVGTQKQFEAGSSTNISVCPIGTNKALVAYRDVGNSNYGTACAMSVSGTTISTGTAVVFASTSCSDIATCKLNTDKALVVYSGTNSYANACAMTVSTLTITAGTPLIYKSALTEYKSIVQVATDKALVCYALDGSGDAGTSIVLSVSSTTVSAGTETTFTSNGVSYTALDIYDITNGKFMATYTDTTNSYYATSCVIVVSGTNIYPEYPIVFNTENSSKHTIAQIETNKMLFGFGESSPQWGSLTVYSQLLATGYAFTAQFNSNSISGRSDNINVVPYIALV